MSLRTNLALTVCVAAALLGGCANSAQPTPPQTAAPDAIAAQVATIKPMTIEEKQSLVATSFQPEVPLPMGDVASGHAQGDTAWDYELVVAAKPEAVANWYVAAYTGRDWVSERTVSSSGAIVLTMTKNQAQTRVTISAEGDNASRVAGVLGVGAPVLQQQ